MKTERWLGSVSAFAHDIRLALRSLMRAKGLTTTVIVTLALGIGANAAVFSVVRTVLLLPLVNRQPDQLIYIRQSAPGTNTENVTFSMPEIGDFKGRAKTVAAFGDFSTVDFTMIGFGGEPRVVKAGVVNGSFFEVMGLRPTVGRLLNAADDGPDAVGAVVLTHRFWTTVLNRDPNVVGKAIRLGPSVATVVGVLEPAVPYPEETQLIANVVTSPHHLGATMVTDRTHRMTELFGRLPPGVTLEAARTELVGLHATMVREHPEAYSKSANVQLRVTTLRDQIASPARSVLLLLLGASAVVFIIACSNVANLILARSVRREGELALRAALGAGQGALRRTLLAESLVLCGAGALLGLLLAKPFVTAAARYVSRFSIRALDATVDSGVLVGVGLAMASAVLLAYVPRLPSSKTTASLRLADGTSRLTPGTNKRLRTFATTQIACSFVLLAGAFMLVATLTRLQTTKTSYEMRQVLAVDLPPSAPGRQNETRTSLLQEAMRRLEDLPGVQAVALGMVVPWRDSPSGLKFQFEFEGYQPANGEDNVRARFRPVSPRFFAVLGVALLAGRDFTEADTAQSEPVAIVSQSIAQRLFPNGEALNRHLWFAGDRSQVRRIVGVVADVDDENVVQAPNLTIYVPPFGSSGRLFVRASGDPYALVPTVTRIIRELSAEQAVERPATLEDIRAQVLGPERLNAFVFSGFAGIALLIAVVGIAGVLAFSVSARTREFGVRLAVGSTPREILTRVLSEGGLIAVTGIVAGIASGYVLTRIAGSYFETARTPGIIPVMAAAGVLLLAAIVASALPAARASRVDVLQALRSE